jgi:tRNA(Ile)-lysidine synthase
MSQTLEKIIATNLGVYLHAPRWFIAYSGGLDSTVLLHVIARLKKTSSTSLPPVSAIHINHQLNPQADAWAAHCQKNCTALDIPLHITRVAIEKNGAGLESAARDARYRAFKDALGKDDVLLQAHHADDQAETVLLRLLRGSGVTGMAAIPAQRQIGNATIVRPLLTITRQQLQDYAGANNLVWIEDDSNFDIKLDRNFLRHEIIPRLQQRWSATATVLARTAAQMADDNLLLRELGDNDWQNIAANAASGEQALTVNGLLALSVSRRNNAIRSWLFARDLPIPDAALLQRISDEVLLAKADAEPCLQWGGVEAHRYANRLFVFRSLPDYDANAEYQWDASKSLTIEGVGTLQLQAPHNEVLTVRFRRGGERCQPEGRAHSQTLKKLMQEYRVPPWLRDRVPLIYRGDELIAVAGYWLCIDSGFLSVEWRR